MTLLAQMALGITLLVVASLVQFWGLMRLHSYAETHSHKTYRVVGLIATLATIHLGQVLLWAVVLHAFAADLADWNDAVYFSLVTYTTVGYGDVTLGPEVRIFGAMASFAGILGFGMSTAFLVSLFTRARL